MGQKPPDKWMTACKAPEQGSVMATTPNLIEHLLHTRCRSVLTEGSRETHTVTPTCTTDESPLTRVLVLPGAPFF